MSIEPSIVHLDVLVDYVKLNIVVLSLLALSAHHFLNCIPYVEGLNILPELAGFNLGEIQEVLNHVIHEHGRVLLNRFTLLQLLDDRHALQVVLIVPVAHR